MKNKEILNKTPILGKMSREELSDEERIGKAKNEINQAIDLKQTLYATSCLNTEDTGRSMTEMLGTLAVIGVLSVAGITGYQYAMNYYRANQVVNELNLLRNELQIKMANGNQELILGSPYDTGEEVGEGHLQSNATYGFTYDCGDGNSGVSDCRDETGFYMEVKEVPEEICRPLRRMVENLSGLENLSVNDVEAGECRNDNNTILLAFEADVILDNRDLPADYCRKHEDCDKSKPICENHKCKACPAGQEWDVATEACIKNKTCISNTNCNTTVNFCNITSFTTSGSCNADNPNYYTNLSGTCTAIGGSSSTNDVTGIGTVYRSNDYMTWWAAKNWCEAQGKSLLDISGTKLGCYWSGTTTAWSIAAGSGIGYCCASGQSCNNGTSTSMNSQPMQDLRAKWGGYGWTATDYYAGENSCYAYYLRLFNGHILGDPKEYYYAALCQ